MLTIFAIDQERLQWIGDLVACGNRGEGEEGNNVVDNDNDYLPGPWWAVVPC